MLPSRTALFGEYLLPFFHSFFNSNLKTLLAWLVVLSGNRQIFLVDNVPRKIVGILVLLTVP